MTETILPRDLPQALDRIGPIKVLLLDLFELVLWCDYGSPEDVFSALMGVTAQQRLDAQKRARNAASGDAPVTLAQIYAHALPDEDEETRQSAIEHELAVMAQRYFVFESAAELMRRAGEAGIRVELIEDTSMTAGQVLELIEQAAGPEIAARFDAVLTSASLGQSKSDGLFDCAVADIDCSPGEILYVGRDGSDALLAARELGLKTLEMALPIACEKLPVTVEMNHNQAQGNCGLDPRRALIALCPRRAASEDYTRGYTTLGPILWGFVRWIEQERIRLHDQRDGNVCLLFAGPGVPVLRRLYNGVYGESCNPEQIDPQSGDTVMFVSLGDVTASARDLERRVEQCGAVRIARRRMVLVETTPSFDDRLGLVDERYFNAKTVDRAAAQIEALATLLSDPSEDALQGCEDFCRATAAPPAIRLSDPNADSSWRNCAALQLLALDYHTPKPRRNLTEGKAASPVLQRAVRPSASSQPVAVPEHGLEVVYADDSNCKRIRVAATRQADSFFCARVELPTGGGSVALQPGDRYSWIEIAALTCRGQDDEKSVLNWLRVDGGGMLGLPMDGVYERRPGVFECIEPDGLILLPQPGPTGSVTNAIEIVYRPLVERSESFDAPSPIPETEGLSATKANARDLSVPGFIRQSSLKGRRINAAV